MHCLHKQAFWYLKTGNWVVLIIGHRETWKKSKKNGRDTNWNEAAVAVIESTCVFPAMTRRHAHCTSSPFYMWISFQTGSRSVPFHTSRPWQAQIPGPGLQDVCDSTIWQDAVCHVGELARPTCEWPDASQPGPLPLLMGPSGSGCHGDGWLVAAAWQWKEREGSQVIESNKSARSQWSELAVNLAFDVEFTRKQPRC